MRGFAPLLRMEMRLQARSYVHAATALSTAIICGFVLALPSRPLGPRLTAFFVFMDPAIIGLSFVGAMVLAEKSRGTLAALCVTPVPPVAYVAARTVGLTLLTLVSSLAVLYVAAGGALDPLRQLPALILCSAVAVLIGLVCVARADTMNQLVIRLLWVSTILYLPLLAHFGAGPDALAVAVAAVPSCAMLVLLTAAAEPGAVSTGAEIAAAIYLASWIGLGWTWAVREFERVVLTESR